MTEIQKLYDKLGKILVTTPEFMRDLQIEIFCRDHNIPIKKIKVVSFRKKTLPELPFDATTDENEKENH